MHSHGRPHLKNFSGSSMRRRKTVEIVSEMRSEGVLCNISSTNLGDADLR